jgi:osmoprotectant transport system permease protein
VTYGQFWSFYKYDLLSQLRDHLTVVLVAVAAATVLGVGASVLLYRTAHAETLIRFCGILLTIPSLALYVLLLVVFGLGWWPVIVALAAYALCPIVQNTIVALRGVDPATLDAADGIGMAPWRRLVTVELPLAWPVILAGIRVGAALLVSTAAIGAVILGPGLGNAIYAGLNRIGSPVALYFALTGLVGTALVGLVLNAGFSLLGRTTISRGIRD